jgi:putative ABC transport system permease protein
VVIEGAPPPRPGEATIVFSRAVLPGYFKTLQVRLIRGRFFTPSETAGTRVAIVNETMARKCWPNQDAIGKRFGDGRVWLTVVGVIGDMRQTSLADEPDLESYVPYTQTPSATMALVARTTMDPMQLAPAVRAAVKELDKDLPLADVGLLAESVSHSTRSRRFSAWVLGAFALLALLLAAVGIYGVISYSVTRRRHEIGMRMALGAERGRIAAMVVRRAVALAAMGVTLGVAGGLALTRLLQSMLFGVSATDPVVFGGASVFLLCVAALAGYLPARRAARIEPSAALRAE